MIPPHLFYQIYLSFLEQNDCTTPKCGELSEYIDSAHSEVEDLSSRYMNGSNMYDRCGHDTRQLHPSCTAIRRTANIPGWVDYTYIDVNALAQGIKSFLASQVWFQAFAGARTYGTDSSAITSQPR